MLHQLRKLITILGLTLLAACAGQLRIPTEYDAARGAARWDCYDLSELQRGRELYVLKCGSCHALHLPEELSETDWSAVFPEMREEAKLDDAQSGLILKYLLVMASNDTAEN